MDYSRQVKLIGEEGQKKLRNSNVAIVGVGALGTVVSELLARSGVNLVLIDRDIVEESNLQRQLLFDSEDLNKPKASTAKEKLIKINSDIYIEAYDETFSEIKDKLDVNLVVDCTDNLETRFLINKYCFDKKIPMIYGAAVASRGMVFFVNKGACFNCIFEKAESSETCSDEGILNSASAIIGSLQANEIVKYIIGEENEKDMIFVDVSTNTFEKIKVGKDENCSVCGEMKKKDLPFKFEIKKCKTKAAYTAKPNKNVKLDLNKIRAKYDIVMDTPILVVINSECGEIIVHHYGELIFKKCEDELKIKEVSNDIYATSL